MAFPLLLAIDLEPKRHADSGRLARVVCVGHAGVFFEGSQEWTPGHAVLPAADTAVELRWHRLEELVTYESRGNRDRERMLNAMQSLDSVEVRGLSSRVATPFWIAAPGEIVECVTVRVSVDLLLRKLWDSPDVRASETLIQCYTEQRSVSVSDCAPGRDSTADQPLSEPAWLPVEVSTSGVAAVLRTENAEGYSELILSRRMGLTSGTVLHRTLEWSFEGKSHRESAAVARITSIEAAR